MLDRITNSLPKWFTRDSITWVFLSWYDASHLLLASQWAVVSDQPLWVTLTTLWEDSFKELKGLDTLAVDVVADTIEINDLSTLGNYDPEEFGFVMIDTDDDRSGVILPHTAWVTDAKHALWAMKEKYWLHGKVEVIAFRTHRTILAK